MHCEISVNFMKRVGENGTPAHPFKEERLRCSIIWWTVLYLNMCSVHVPMTTKLKVVLDHFPFRKSKSAFNVK